MKLTALISPRSKTLAPRANYFERAFPSFTFFRTTNLRSCCLLMCNMLANSPANKSMALKFGLFDVVRVPAFVALQMPADALAHGAAAARAHQAHSFLCAGSAAASRWGRGAVRSSRRYRCQSSSLAAVQVRSRFAVLLSIGVIHRKQARTQLVCFA